MNTSTLESFISYCDTMMIAEEGFVSHQVYNLKRKPENIPWTRANFFPDEEIVELSYSKNKARGELQKMIARFRTNKQTTPPMVNEILPLLANGCVTKKEFDKMCVYFKDDYEILSLNMNLFGDEPVKNTELKEKFGLYPVATDGGGNNLFYSTRTGSFYDQFHETDDGLNAETGWLRVGIPYDALINTWK